MATLIKKPLEQIYGRSFFSRRYKLNWRAPIVCDAMMLTFKLDKGDTVIDVGCAQGDFVAEFNENTGIIAFGIEGSQHSKEFFSCNPKVVFMDDLREPLNLDVFFNLCMCMEVAEHIEPEYADVFVDNLCSLSETIVLSAATPGQGGHYHVNCQPFEYWEEKFQARGYERWTGLEARLKYLLEPWKHKDGIRAYWWNILVFKRVRKDR